MGLKAKIAASFALVSIFLTLCGMTFDKWRNNAAYSRNNALVERLTRSVSLGDSPSGRAGIVKQEKEKKELKLGDSSYIFRTSRALTQEPLNKIEEMIFNRFPRLIEVKWDFDNSTTGKRLFGLLLEAVNNICENRPLSGFKNWFGYGAFIQRRVIIHYTKYLRDALCRLNEMYFIEDLEPNIMMVDIYRKAVDCLMGQRLGYYHFNRNLNGYAKRYFNHIGQFVRDIGVDVVVSVGNVNNRDMFYTISLKEHIIYVILDYICNYYDHLENPDRPDYERKIDAEGNYDPRLVLVDHKLIPKHYTIATVKFRPWISDAASSNNGNAYSIWNLSLA